MALDLGTLVAKVKVDDSDLGNKSKGWSAWGGTVASTFGNLAASGIQAAGDMLGDFIAEAAVASDATDKFRKSLEFAGLDTSAIDALTASTQAYADETVYSLTDIQSITATLASNGIAGPDALAKALGNLNAVAGGNAETFGRVGQVLGQTAGAQKLTTENWQQLAEAIPGAAGPLMDALLNAGAYTGNFRDAMAEGQITAEEFNAAIQQVGTDPIAVEAAKSTETFEGAAGNLAATIQGKLVTALGAVKGPVTDFVSAFASFIGNIEQWTPVLAGVGAVILAALAPAIWAGVVAVWAFTAALLANPITWIVLGIGLLVAGIVWLIQNWDIAVSFITTIWGGFMDWLGGVIDGFLGWWNGVWSAVSQFFIDVWNNVASFAQGVWSGIAGFFRSVWQGVTDVWNSVWQGLVDFFTPIVDFIAGLIRFYVEMWVNIFLVLAAVLVTVWQGISDFAIAAWNGIVGFLSPIITGLVDFIVGYFTSLFNFWSGVWNNIVSFVTGAWNAVVSFLQPAVSALVAFVTSYFTALWNTWQTIWTNVSSFLSGIWNGIVSFVSGAVNSVVGVVSGAVNTVQSVWNSAWSQVSSFLSGVWSNISNAVRSGVDGVVSTVSGLWGRVMGFFSGAGSWLYSVGRNIVEGLANGIGSMVQTVINSISNVVNGAIDWAKSTLGIASPSKLFRSFGVFVGEGLALGLQDEQDSVDAQMRKLVEAPPVHAPDAGSWDVSGSGGFGRSVVKNITYIAAEHQSLTSEEALYAALGSPRVKD